MRDIRFAKRNVELLALKIKLNLKFHRSATRPPLPRSHPPVTGPQTLVRPVRRQTAASADSPTHPPRVPVPQQPRVLTWSARSLP